jgi:tetratricopeptide (TPR) repeat protein
MVTALCFRALSFTGYKWKSVANYPKNTKFGLLDLNKNYIFAAQIKQCMATYKARGFKSPKPKGEKEDAVEEVIVDENNSTTAGVFNKLDETASKTEQWVAKNQKYILSGLSVIAIITVAYLLYQRFVVTPKENDAAEQLFTAQQNFQKAIDGDVKADSLFNLALKGSEGKFGFLAIAEEYSGTDAGNMAHYYAGISLLNTGKYSEAIAQLEQFKADDAFLSVLACGAVGDAYAQQNKLNEALLQYVKAAEMKTNEFTTPRYLLKAGQTALVLGKKEEALKHFNAIKEKYESTPEGASVDAYIGLSSK